MLRSFVLGSCAALALAGCDCNGELGGGDGGRVDAASMDSGARRDTGPAPMVDAAGCEAPDALIVLDRTMSMHRTPAGATPADTVDGRATSKWAIAVNAIEAFTAELDTTVRFGLELFPRHPDGAFCPTVSERINGMTADNPNCEAGTVVVPPNLDTADLIAAAIDPETTPLCRSTPIGPGLETASTELMSIQDPIREQIVILITDGQDTCDGALPIAIAQALARVGVRTFVIGFGTDTGADGIDPRQLNDLACAGQTAIGFPAPCVDDGSGNYTAIAGGAAVYLPAEDQATLVETMRDIAGDVCCGCLI